MTLAESIMARFNPNASISKPQEIGENILSILDKSSQLPTPKSIPLSQLTQKELIDLTNLISEIQNLSNTTT